jgi:hypothetical protein
VVPRARVAPALIARRLAATALLLCAAAAAHAGGLFGRFCDVPQNRGAADHDRLLRFAAVAKQELEASGARAAIVARSGLALERFGVRYSHAGLSLKASANGAWSVRQLYFSCDEGRPRIYDQGMAGFVFGSADAQLGYLSILTLPADDEARLEAAALDRELALSLLGADYSANAYAFGLSYQNCNQWLAELIAAAWAPLARDAPLRAEAQRWLAEQGYTPTPIDLGSRWLMAAVAFVPWLRVDDHPEQDLQALRFRISLPASIEAFVRQRLPGARRIELCHDGRRVVVRRGWVPIEAGCVASGDDRVIALD